MNKKQLITTGILSASSITSIHIINRVYHFLYTSKNILSCSENYYYKWRFGNIRYDKKGKGSPLLFIHDLTVGSSSYEFHRLINNLTDKHEVYSLDLLGYGLSDKPSITYTNNLYEQLITDFIKNIIQKKTSIVATGSSVPFVIMACHNNPEFFDKLIFINPQSLYSQNQIPSSQTKFLKLVFETPIIGTFIYNILNTKHSFEKTFRKEYFYDKSKIKEKYILNYLEASQTFGYSSKYSFISYAGKFTNTNIIHALKEINNSILMIGGANKKDIETTLENYTYYNSSIELEYLPETKHLPQLEAPDKVLEQIKWFT
ncbi:MAG: alpha/beta fold hydrolase [Bacillus sp. (in: Bacteria)]|nr:alpha/beta fold hydrolase [Bacillus sp. (in: firmicutes)]MCM1425358.1 alpha/beta fold hydrolase [Eubacterium sp.]